MGAFHGAHLAARRVEQQHAGMRDGTTDARVEAAPVQFLAVILLECAALLDLAPQASWLINPHARPTVFLDHQAGEEQRLISHHLGRESRAWASAQQPVFRVQPQTLRVGGRVLPVGSAHQHLPEQALDIPAVLDKVHREPVE